MKKLWFKWWKQEFTVACEFSPFPYPGNLREVLFHEHGSIRAWCRANKWVSQHPCGHARVIPGLHYHALVVEDL